MFKFFVFLFGLSSAVKFQVMDSSTYTYIRRNQLQNQVVSKNGVLEVPLNNVFCAGTCNSNSNSCDCQTNSDCFSNSNFITRCPAQTLHNDTFPLCCNGQCTEGQTNSNCGSCGHTCQAPSHPCMYANQTYNCY